jgi:hypothetical protein
MVLVVHLAWILMTVFRFAGFIVVFVGVTLFASFLLEPTHGPRMAVFRHPLGSPQGRKMEYESLHSVP